MELARISPAREYRNECRLKEQDRKDPNQVLAGQCTLGNQSQKDEIERDQESDDLKGHFALADVKRTFGLKRVLRKQKHERAEHDAQGSKAQRKCQRSHEDRVIEEVKAGWRERNPGALNEQGSDRKDDSPGNEDRFERRPGPESHGFPHYLLSPLGYCEWLGRFANGAVSFLEQYVHS